MNTSFGPEQEYMPLSDDEQMAWASVVSETASLPNQHLVSQILKGNKSPQTSVTCDRIQMSARNIWKPVNSDTEV